MNRDLFASRLARAKGGSRPTISDAFYMPSCFGSWNLSSTPEPFLSRWLTELTHEKSARWLYIDLWACCVRFSNHTP